MLIDHWLFASNGKMLLRSDVPVAMQGGTVRGYQHGMNYLDLSNNRFTGEVPTFALPDYLPNTTVAILLG